MYNLGRFPAESFRRPSNKGPEGEIMSLNAASRLPMFTLFVSALFLTTQTATPQTKDAPPQSNSPAPRGKASAGIELLTDPEGVDFNNCLRQVYFSVQKNSYASMPPSVEKGNQGVNAVKFRILRDGSVPKDSVELMYRSGKDELDTASLPAVREAEPFKPLPEKFSQPFILLRITFYYNLKPPTP
jgi:TonB family protein